MKPFLTIFFIAISAILQAATYYVSSSRPNDTGNGTSWGTAKKTIQAAVDLTVNGDAVLVTNGTYNAGGTLIRAFDYPFTLTNRVVITNSITVKSINGPDVTVIEGSGVSQFGTSRATRCVYMSKGILDGFTLQNGATFGGSYLGSVDDKEYETSGGGVNMYQSASGTYVTNCVIRNCTAGSGGGVAYGEISNCVISSNSACGNFTFGGGRGLTRGYGGGVYWCLTLRDCRIEGNTISISGNNGDGNSTYGSGGGGYVGTYINCIIMSNLVAVGTAPSSSAAYGGGVGFGALTNCLVVGNTVTTYGAPWGGGVYQGSIVNSTIAGNRCIQTQTPPPFSYSTPRSVNGGGTYEGTIRNSIIYSNSIQTASQITNNYYMGDIAYSCTSPMPISGDGNINQDPKFSDASARDFRLQTNSLCINSGNNLYIDTTKDLAGLPRIHNGTVDMGAYENIPIFSVSFNVQSGSAPLPSSITVTNSFVYGPLAITTKAGYNFGGWYTNTICTGTSITASTTVSLTSAHTLYAKWTPNTYMVTFDAQGGTTPTPSSITVTNSFAYGALATTTKAGYIFGGWYTNIAFTGTVITDATIVATTSDHALYAKWMQDPSYPYYVVGGTNITTFGVTNAVNSDTANSGDGLNSLKLGGIGLLADGQMAGIEWSATGPGILVFDWKVSSEADWDWLRFYEVGKSPTNQISGNVDWSRMSVTVTGALDAAHTFRWEYEKDPAGEYFEQDAGWVDAISWTPLHTMAINNGSGDGLYTNNASVSLTADAPLAHYEFDRWTGDTNTVANIFSSSTTLAMPNTNITVTATYKPILYTLTVSNGTGGGSYSYASSVEIRASAFENKRFYRWTGDITSVTDVNAATTTVVTSDQTISLTATYSVPLTVNSGTGSGWYPEGSLATVSADADPMWKEFSIWTGDAGLLSNANARATTLTLPTGSATVTATYKDSVARLTGSYGRTYSEYGTVGAITPDASAGSPAGTPAVKLGGSGVIPDNGFAAFETVVSGSGSILFQWKVSSESNGDYLKFKVDGSEVAAISGTKGPWTQVSNRVTTAGSHTLRWEYVKNGSSATSTDAGWVDDIIWIGDEQAPSFAPVIVNAVLTNQNMAIQFTGERGMTYLIQTNGALEHSGWSDYQTLRPTWISESNGVHRFEIVPSALGHDRLFYQIVTPVTNVPPVVPFVMVAIPAGTNSGTDPDFGTYSLTVEAFYMDATEVTKAKWDEVYTWAVAHGYSFTNAGLGKASSHPVHSVDWYDCVKWCNARSQKEGKTPCYNLSDWSCNFSANGYRLPTETEWEYAARGGLSSKRFPWGDIIDHTRANYCAYPSSFTYDHGYAGYDTRYTTGEEPYTSPVGTFEANGYGLYDMAGNIWEWCNDASGSDLDFRGGGWDIDAGGARCRYTYWFYPPRATRTDLGFRTVCR